jgi:hydroxymethylbilane synthase
VSDAIRLGTRRSALATAQSQQIADALASVAGRPVELVPITSEGDVNRASLSELGGRGVFATRLREALLAGECDLLVHSLKDLPTAPAPGLVIAATPTREDARDVVLTRDGATLDALRAGAVVGTGSPRRMAQVAMRNRRISTQDLRGNIDSRMARVHDGELDAVILAAAGLARLGHVVEGLIGEPLGLAEWPTAPGQGALAVETRADAPTDLHDAIAALDDLSTRVAVTAERGVLAGLDAGCSAPVGVHAEWLDGVLRVRAVVYAPDGSTRVGIDRTVMMADGYAVDSGGGNGAHTADDADPVTRAWRTGDDIARELLDRGAAEVAP